MDSNKQRPYSIPETKQVRSRAVETSGRILDAAEEVVLERGGRELTLEAAARAAGLSKGGVLYHFPSKTALIRSMLTRWIDRCEADLYNAVASTNDSQTYLTAYVRGTFHACERDKRMGAALLAVLADNPDLMEPLSAFYQRRFEALRRPGIQFGVASTVMLAVEGLFMLELLGLSYLSEAERREVEHSLLTMAGESHSAESDA